MGWIVDIKQNEAIKVKTDEFGVQDLSISEGGTFAFASNNEEVLVYADL